MAMPRNPAHGRHSVQVRLPVDLLDAIDAECASRIIGRNKLVEHLLRDGLTRLAPVTLGDSAPSRDDDRDDSKSDVSGRHLTDEAAG